MTLNYKTFGQGPSLIILHGLFGSLDNWATHAKILSDTYSVYIIDLRNHGKSPHSDIWDYPSMAEDIHEWMESEGISVSHLLGHSMGGKTAIQFAAVYPEKIDKLVVADMGIKQNPPSHTEILRALNALDLQTINNRSDADEQLTDTIQDQSIRQFLLKSLGRDASGNFNWKFNLKAITNNYENILAEVRPEYPIEKETLFLTGGRSSYVTEEDHEDIRSVFPHVVFTSIPNAGHWLHAEAPEEFLQILRDFLG